MFRKLLCSNADALSAAEEAAISRLASGHRRLLMDAGRVNTKSEAGFNFCAVFLDNLDATARTFRLTAAPRGYRVDFTINYRALFPDEARNYRVDVLEASVEQYAVIWVNGDKFEFSAEAMRRAEALQRAWADLCLLLDRWSLPDQNRSVARPGRLEFRNSLVALDTAWASFEHKYIVELIEIEEKARRLIVQAIEHERCLQLLEAHHGQGEALNQLPEYREEQKKLVACIAHLNSVANFRRKGRDDLGIDVYHDAVRTLARCDVAESRGENTELLRAARILAKDIVESFALAREYLHEVERCLERVDPHLCNNAGLVLRLVDWEESWEVGARYVQNQPLLTAVCDLVAELRVAVRIAPLLNTYIEEMDVNMFFIIPRIAWLRCLNSPNEPWRTALLKSLLPYRFESTSSSPAGNSQACSWDSELEVLVQKFSTAKAMLLKALPAAPGNAEKAFWQVLVKRAVNGQSNNEDNCSSLLLPHREQAVAALEELMHELEGPVLETQRHCPEDWNQCSSILSLCLGGQTRRQNTKNQPFRV